MPIPFPAIITVGSDDCLANGETFPLPIVARTLPAGIDSRCYSNSNRPVPNVLDGQVIVTGGISSTPLIWGAVFVGGGLLDGSPFTGGGVLVGGGIAALVGGGVLVGGGLHDEAPAGGTIFVTGYATQPVHGSILVGGNVATFPSSTVFVGGGVDVFGTAAGGGVKLTGGIHDLVHVGGDVFVGGGVRPDNALVGGTVFLEGGLFTGPVSIGGDVFVGGGVLPTGSPFVGGTILVTGTTLLRFGVGGTVFIGGVLGAQVGGDVFVGGGVNNPEKAGGDVFVGGGTEGELFILGGASCAAAVTIQLATTYRLDTTTGAQQWFTVPYDRDAMIAVNIVVEVGGIQFSTLYQGSCASLVTILNSMGGVTITGFTTGAPGDLFYAITPPAGAVIVFAIYWT